MIYQCYFADSQRARLFDSPLYTGFGLYSAVNPDIMRNCPELTEPVQAQLSEYGAMLHLWRNPERIADAWIGFTSYRQLDKFPTIFKSREEIETMLTKADVVGWGGYRFFDATSRRPLSLAEDAERRHPGLNSCLWQMLMLHNEPLPPNYLIENTGLFCNYWLMSRQNFDEYMKWSFPMVQWRMANPHPFMNSDPRGLAYIVERLFICWCGLKRKKALHIGPLNEYFRANPLQRKIPAGEAVPVVSHWHVTLSELAARHGFAPRGIIHIGAHYAEEREVYQKLGARNVLWIEADPAHLPRLQANIAPLAGQRAIQACLSNVDGQITSFFRTNNQGESSSILPMGTHRQEMSYINVVEQTLLTTTTFAALVASGTIDPSLYDALVIDVQGAELLVMQGFGDLLGRFDVVYLEVNLKHLYVGCALLPEIDQYLKSFGFSRRETLITRHNYGDGLYLRDARFPAPPADLTERLKRIRAEFLARRTFIYRIAGAPDRTLEFMETGLIGDGKAQFEQSWLMRVAGPQILVEIAGSHGRTGYFAQAADGHWRGQIVLSPFPAAELISE